MLLDTRVCDVCLQNHAGYTGKRRMVSDETRHTQLSSVVAVMMAAVIDIANEDQRQVIRRLFRESGNVNVKTTQACFSSPVSLQRRLPSLL